MTMNTNRAVAFDHFVYLLDRDEFESPPAWLRDNFHVIEGGTHAGGSSRNKLIIFKDGTYLELFSWIEEPREFLDWADKSPGLIDLALTNLPPVSALQNFVPMAQALQSDGDGGLGVSYDHPRTGGRKRKDGVDVKWETTRPLLSDASNTPNKSLFPTRRLDVPFYCHDLTERSVRVPFEDEGITDHPCGALGVSAVELLVPVSHFEHYQTLYETILGVKGSIYEDASSQRYASFPISVPNAQMISPILILRAIPTTEQGRAETSEQRWLRERGIGIRSLTLMTDGSQGIGDKTPGSSGQVLDDGSVLLVG